MLQTKSWTIFGQLGVWRIAVEGFEKVSLKVPPASEASGRLVRIKQDLPFLARYTTIVLEAACGRRGKEAGKGALGSTQYVSGRSASLVHGIFPAKPGEPDGKISMKNPVYVEVFGDRARGRLLRLNNVEWRRGEKLRMQMIPARKSLDSRVQYVSVELKLNSKNEAHINYRHGIGSRERRNDRIYRQI